METQETELGHRMHTDAELAALLKRVVSGGQAVKPYCIKRGWSYMAVRSRLVASGHWKGIMRARAMRQYGEPAEAPG